VNILLCQKHWLAISDLNRLLGKDGKNSHHCYRCLRNFHFRDRLEKHMPKCYNSIGQKESMPTKEEMYKTFDDWNKLLSPPFVLYADIEALLLQPPLLAEEPDDGRKKVKILQTHSPIAVGSYLVAHEELISFSQRTEVNFQTGNGCVQEFCKYLDELVHDLYQHCRKHCNKPQRRTVEEETKFNDATQCEYCKVVFNEAIPKVHHHCHISGKMLAVLCQRCNTRIHQSITTLPILFHNLKNYDMHALCIEGFSNMPHWNLKPIAQTKERYLTLQATTKVDTDAAGKPIYYKLRFIDSFQFLTASLERLANSLNTQSMHHVEAMRQRHGGVHQIDDDVLFGKGIFPYSYLDHASKLEEVELPGLPAFFDKLSNSMRTSTDDYDRAQKAYRQFNCHSIEDYLLRYLELDCCLLADIFETFRHTAINNSYGLDPVNFITLPQYSFAAAFFETQVDLLTDVEMYCHFEQGIRGGMCFVNTHQVKRLHDDNESVNISYWDANNLYGDALQQLLPCANFRWLDEEEMLKIDWLTIDTEREIGYTLKLDLNYPDNIHDKTQDYPLAPHSALITRDMLTPLMRQQWSQRCQLRGMTNTYKAEKKLLMTVSDKKEYVVHFKLLKFYLQMGMTISRIHSVISYTQKAIFKSYIAKNSALRQQAASEFDKDLYKLLNNSLFGKTMENVRGRKCFNLVNTKQKLMKQSRLPHFLCAHKFNENLVLTEKMNLEVKLDKPIYIGQAVLDLSKLIMYRLRYEKLAAYAYEFNGSINVIGGDTDSLFCTIHNIDLYNQLHPAMLRDDLLDTSNYPRHHALYSDRNKAKLGCIKDEVCGEELQEAILLRPKCYSMITASGLANKKTAKGIQYCVRQSIKHEEYAKVFELQQEQACTVRRFQSTNHVVNTIELTKWALSAADNKRAWISSNESLPFGHYKLRNINDDDAEDEVVVRKRPRV
jgi:hypothetical protein